MLQTVKRYKKYDGTPAGKRNISLSQLVKLTNVIYPDTVEDYMKYVALLYLGLKWLRPWLLT